MGLSTGTIGLIIGGLIILVFLGVLFAMWKHKSKGGYVRQDYALIEGPRWYNPGTRILCGLTGTIPLLVSDFLIEESTHNIDQLPKKEKGISQFRRLLTAERDRILDPNRGYQIANLCGLGTFIYNYTYNTYYFNFIKFLKIFLGIPRTKENDFGNWRDWDTFRSGRINAWYKVGYINPIIDGRQKILLAIRKENYNPDYINYKIKKLTMTLVPSKRGNEPILPIVQLGTDTHVHLYMYNHEIKRWVDYNDTQTGRANTYNLSEFGDLIFKKEVQNYYLYLYDVYKHIFLINDHDEFNRQVDYISQTRSIREK